MKQSLIAVFSDPHGGHKLGLCNPETIIENDDTGEIKEISPVLNDAQLLLWEVYSNAIENVKLLAGKDDVMLWCIGDLTQGNHYISEQMTTRIADQLFIAEYIFYPWFDKIPKIEKVRIAKGTGSHEFGEGSSSLAVAKSLRAKFPKKDIRSVYHGLARTNQGIFIDYAHHGPYPGSRNWLKGNEARYYLRSIMIGELNSGNIPPHIVLRGHYHEYVKEYLSIIANGTEHESWITIIPSMDMFPSHDHLS